MYKGSLEGHGGWVTAIATSSENPDMILTSSRGASLLATFCLSCVSFLPALFLAFLGLSTFDCYNFCGFVFFFSLIWFLPASCLCLFSFSFSSSLFFFFLLFHFLVKVSNGKVQLDFFKSGPGGGWIDGYVGKRKNSDSKMIRHPTKSLSS